MLVLLSPAKSLDWSPVPAALPATEPVLQSDMGVLMRVMKGKSAQDLSSLMHLSDSLSTLNHERYTAMTGAPDAALGRPAALAFNGDVYRGLSARTLTEADLEWANGRLAILSGLYGVLRPLDRIEPYRLEMGTRLPTRRGSHLYDFWDDRVTKVLNGWLKTHDPAVVVNLASNEYARVVKKKLLNARIVTPLFKEIDKGKVKTISFFAKRARGMMARYIVEERIQDPKALLDFSGGGYRFDADLSQAESWVFTRPKPPPAR
jgi:hypothetical protein